MEILSCDFCHKTGVKLTTALVVCDSGAKSLSHCDITSCNYCFQKLIDELKKIEVIEFDVEYIAEYAAILDITIARDDSKKLNYIELQEFLRKVYEK